MRGWGLLLPLLLLAACASVPLPRAAAPVTVGIIAINDFHGNLEPPHSSVAFAQAGGGTVSVPAGGAAYLASAVARTRAEYRDSVVVGAGDLVGASPLTSALFLDEPSILALNGIDLSFSAVGNHEFDRGPAELMRLAHGGCAKLTPAKPCQLEPMFPGARFAYLAANVVDGQGRPLFPGTALRRMGGVTIGFIGETLANAPDVIAPDMIAGLRFGDEASAANAAARALRAAGADAVVLLIHEGAITTNNYPGTGCEGLSGRILPILDRLDDTIDVVVSGHTHRQYICSRHGRDPAHSLLLTSAGSAGMLLTDIRLRVDPVAHRLVAAEARNIVVQGEAYQGATGPISLTHAVPRFRADPPTAALVARYHAAAASLIARPVGCLSAAMPHDENDWRESALGDFTADAQLAAVPGADVALMNKGGIRAPLLPAADGSITYGQIYAVQPFGNRLQVKTLSGSELLALLEDQFADRRTQPALLSPSATLRYAVDRSAAAGARVREVRVAGTSLDPARRYRVVLNGFLGAGGDDFPLLRGVAVTANGPIDLEALQAYLSANPRNEPPAADRVTISPAR